MDRVLQSLSDYMISLDYQKLPKNVVHEVKRHTIDTLGCAMGGLFCGTARNLPELRSGGNG